MSDALLDMDGIHVNPEALARSADPHTSHEAAASLTDLRRQRAVVYNLFDIFGPMTDETMLRRAEQVREWDGRHIHISPSGARTRRSELVRAGLLADTGERRKTSSGRSAIVWAAVA